MTTPDIRIKVGFFNHPKTQQFKTLFGAEGIIALIKLWLFAAEYRPKGILTDLSEKAILSIMGLNEQQVGPQTDSTSSSTASIAGDLLDALLKLRFLEKDRKGVYRIHDWKEHNPYAYFAPERSAKASKAAAIRYGKRNNLECTGHKGMKARSNAGGKAGSNAKRNAPSPAPLAGEENRLSLDGRSVSPPEFNPGPI
jgi:hypothetical protein